MTNNIIQLSDDIANKIAAGEVIERPAAVVKELVENSIDANSTRITIKITGGGQELIEISDDGDGIKKDELPLAISRHATSKLKKAEDLFSISTLGFRGEALPSIAGVSEMKISSCAKGEEQGYEIICKDDNPIEPSSTNTGTKITVRNLFWNVPVRLKFLKKAGTEAGYISDIVQRLAIGHPEISFSLYSNDKKIIETQKNETLKSRIRNLFGKNISDGLIETERIHDTAQVSGYITKPSMAKPTGKRQMVFLNGRFIHDKLIVAAVREGYKGFLESRMHAIVFLHIDIETDLVDVNVHPTKAEVRFRNSSEIFGMIKKAIQLSLESNKNEGFTLFEETEANAQLSEKGSIVSRKIVKEPISEMVHQTMIQERFIPNDSPIISQEDRIKTNTLFKDNVDSVNDTNEKYNSDLPIANDPLSSVKQIVQLKDSYILIETDDGVRIIDQHALHEKALYLTLDQSIDFTDSGKQELLIPQRIELTAIEVSSVEPFIDDLRDRDIDVEVFGPTTLLLRAHPVILQKTNWEDFFSLIAEGQSSNLPFEKIQERIKHKKSCVRARKAGEKLSPSELREMVRLLLTIEGVEHCPHGRPTTLDLSWLELERRFQR